MELETSNSNNACIPPIQIDPSRMHAITENPISIPQFCFAAVKLIGPDEIEILKSYPKRELVNEGELYTELVTQTYMVQIPYTVVEDGKEVTKLRVDHRTRKVPVQRRRPKIDEATGDQVLVEQSYTVSVPYTETCNGQSITRCRLETRTRMIDPNQPPVRYSADVVSDNYPLSEIGFYDVAGTAMNEEAIRERLANGATPIVLINSAEHITSYFGNLLRPDAMFIVEPAKSQLSRIEEVT